MGPTNLALVKLFEADKALREAQERLANVTREVRAQERKTTDLSAKVAADRDQLRHSQSQANQLELDVQSRDTRIERLRTQQQTANTNREYQTFLVEINTEKVDKGKIEDELLKALEFNEKLAATVKEASDVLQAEQSRLEMMRSEIGDKVRAVEEEIAEQQPLRDAAAAAVPKKALDAFERLAEHHEGQAMAAIAQPDRRREEYICTACMMALVTDVYNKLHSRDELVFCPSCRRILYIPADLPAETAVKKPRIRREPRGKEIGAAIGRQTSAFDVAESVNPESETSSQEPVHQEIGDQERAPHDQAANAESGDSNQI